MAVPKSSHQLTVTVILLEKFYFWKLGFTQNNILHFDKIQFNDDFFIFFHFQKVLITVMALLGISLVCLRNTSPFFKKKNRMSNGDTHPFPTVVPGNSAVGSGHHHRLLLLLPGGQELQDYGIV